LPRSQTAALQPFDDLEALCDDHRVVADLPVAPERFVSAASVGDGLEALSLVDRERKIDIACAKQSNLGGLYDGHRMIVEVEQHATVTDLR
jgi:hypothetical protein